VSELNTLSRATPQPQSSELIRSPVLNHSLGLSAILLLSSSLSLAVILLFSFATLLLLGTLTQALLQKILLRLGASHAYRLPALIVLLAAYTSLIDGIVGYALPTLFSGTGPSSVMLPLLCSNFLLLCYLESQHLQDTLRDSFIPGVKILLGYGTVVLTFTACRELLAFGTLFHDSAQLLNAQVIEPLLSPLREFVLSPAGGFSLLGIFIAAANALRPWYEKLAPKAKTQDSQISAPRARVTEKLQ